MSLRTASLAFIGPGFVAKTLQHSRYTEIQYVGGTTGEKIPARELKVSLAHQAFTEQGSEWWYHSCGVGAVIVEDHGLVAGLNLSFDCLQHTHFEAWISFCEKLKEIGFRVTGEEGAGRNEICGIIQSSTAWGLRSSPVHFHTE